MTYAVGTSLLYGRMGVCRIEGIGASPSGKDNGRCYYKLCAVFSASKERVYIPVDAAGSLRPLTSGSEALCALNHLPQLKPKICRSKRPAELTAHYQEMLAPGRLEDSLLLLKEIYWKERELASHGKKLGQVDISYLKIAERLSCEELAAALDTTPELMKERVYEALACEAAS